MRGTLLGASDIAGLNWHSAETAGLIRRWRTGARDQCRNANLPISSLMLSGL